ncbi:hypothetical protein [Mycobacterium triplex]|uniref:Uncharacterized protein n=1 Tax=Mycobacterium triplex TaxID=47839 RepID=A0A024JYQ1_9MYCO|nr:hypothetical protein [Mycobacterium triplex]CDO88955.1 hypothetical protein BN973_03325 [Mycobacterium triplex]
MANAPESTVIFLQSHPAWIAAQRRERERVESMRRHPSFRARRGAVQVGHAVAAGSRHFKLYSTGDTPA